MIYTDKDLVLKLGKRGIVYYKDKLLFMGDTRKAMKLFISHSNNQEINKKLLKIITESMIH